MKVVELHGRGDDRDVASLLAVAQIHHGAEEARQRGPAIAREYATSDHLRLWGCESRGVVVAVIGVEPTGADTAIIRDLAVAEADRRKGIGRMLLDFLRRDAGFASLEGDTLVGSAPFYERCGFAIAEDGAMPNGETRFRFSWRRPHPLTSDI